MIGNAPQTAPLAAAMVRPNGAVDGPAASPRRPQDPNAWQRFRRHRITRKLGRILRATRGFFPMTVAGLVLLIASALAIWLEGIRHLDLVLLVAGLTTGVVTFLMFLVVVIAAIYLHLGVRQARSRQPLSLEADVFQWTGFQTTFQPWIPWVLVDWRWLDHGRPDEKMLVTLPREERRLVETVQPAHRGVYRMVERRFMIRDLLGLACIFWDETEKSDVQILPSRGKLDDMSVLSSLFWGDDISDPRGDPSGDRVDMRQYARGDSPRMILWKVYARSRKLMVRIPERAITARPRACGYLVGGPATEAVSGLARVVLERNLLGEGWRFGADGTPGHAIRLPEALAMVAQSGSLPDELVPGTALRGYLEKAQREGYSSLFLFLPSELGPWVTAVQHALAGTPLKISIFLGSDCLIDARPTEPRWRRWVLQDRPDRGPGTAELSEVAAQFHRSVSEIWRVDRQAGRFFSASAGSDR